MYLKPFSESYRRYLNATVLALSGLFFWTCSSQESNKQTEALNDGDTARLFSLLEAAQTGIDFNNEVVDGETFNILTYRNFYNGGGVAIGDINNDSLPDLYFTANQKKNKLYLNKGNLVFEDITEKAGVGGNMAWSTGVTMADVNNDGLLDIYVCNSGDVNGKDRENELFINNGDLTFSEQAKTYNLNNEGYSTHAAFFDYDLDGDLDCYILNNSFKDPGKIELYKKVRERPDPGGDKLMRNDGNVFYDVTTQAGIFSSEIGFGLGVSVSDLNGDHMPDIYVSNDFWERDYLYINRGNGKFSEELITRINYCPVSSMGADIADLNNDGSSEIFTTDMLPADNYRLKTTIAFDPYHLEDTKYRANFHYQMVQNCLQLNDGRGEFQEVALLSGVAATDWSWGALIFDFENDGNKDIFVSNGIQRDLMSMDFREFLADAQKRNDIVAKRGKFDYRDFISYMPSTPLKNYAFHNSGVLAFEDQADALGLGQPSFSNGSAYGDLDNDGDFDLVVNNINSNAFVYRNDANKRANSHFLKVGFQGPPQNKFGIGAQVMLKIREKVFALQNFNTRGFQSSIEPYLMFGLGTERIIDSLRVTWPDGKEQILTQVATNRTIILSHKDAITSTSRDKKLPIERFKDISAEVIPHSIKHNENLNNDFNDEILLPRMLSTEGPRLIVGDVNGDKIEDFILLGAAGDPDKLLLQNRDGKFLYRPTPAFISDKPAESTCGVLFDHDKDGDLDLLIGSGGNEPETDRKYFFIRFYKNDGRGNFTRDMGAIPQLIGNFSTIEAEDYDQDGDIDIFVGARCVPGNYGLPPQSYLLNNKEGTWMNVTPPSLANAGMVTDATWADSDGDGDKDLVVVGDWMAITIFQNDNGVIENSISIPNSEGWWNRVEAADLDSDGNVDFVLGNWGLNTKFKASLSKPLTMFVNDFDDNGKSEFIINWYAPLDNRAYPFVSKTELTTQLPSLRKSILKYGDYAYKTYDSLFSSEITSRSLAYKAYYLSNAVLWNNKGSFHLASLPVEAQVSPVFGIIVDDLDDDGKKDIWLAGNFYALKPQAGRHDASHGVLLTQVRNRVFKVTPQAGLTVHGEVRDAVIVSSGSGGDKYILVARNNEKVAVFKKKNANPNN